MESEQETQQSDTEIEKPDIRTTKLWLQKCRLSIMLHGILIVVYSSLTILVFTKLKENASPEHLITYSR